MHVQWDETTTPSGYDLECFSWGGLRWLRVSGSMSLPTDAHARAVIGS